MTKKPVTGRILALLTAVLTMTVMCLPASAFAANGITKDETVYVVTDSSGTQQDVIVSDHLINEDKVKTIADQTNLKDVENVKGEETFKQDGESLTWDAEGNGIYYQGRSEDEIPVAMDIVYRLNDKVVTGSELQGQSGKVEIKINYTNDAEFEGTTVPFVVMTGMVITDDSFKNIKVTKGKVIDDGDKLMVVGMAAPGLAQTLDIGESDLGIGSSVTITGDADKFAVEDMMTVVTNAFFEDIDTDKIDDLDYDDEIKELDKGAKALVDGSDALYEGLDTLEENMPDLQDGVAQLDDGAVQLRGTLKSKMKKIANATGQLHNGTSTILSNLKVMKKGLDGDGTTKNPGAINALDQVSSGLTQGAKKAKEGAANLKKSATGLDQAVQGIGAIDQGLSDGVSSAEQNLNAINTNLTSLDNNNDAVEEIISQSGMSDEQKQIVIAQLEGYKAVATGARDLAAGEKNGMSSAEENLSTVYNNLKNAPAALSGAADELDDSATSIGTAAGAVSQVNDGLKTMSAGLGAYDKKAKEQKTIIGGMTVIDSGLGQLHKEVKKSVSKKGTLTTALNKLVGGTGQLRKGADEMTDGVDKLDDGSKKLADGMSKMYKDGIKKIVDLYNDDLKGTLDSADAMMDAGKGYKTFTRLPSGMDGSVKFIYKTDMTD